MTQSFYLFAFPHPKNPSSPKHDAEQHAVTKNTSRPNREEHLPQNINTQIIWKKKYRDATSASKSTKEKDQTSNSTFPLASKVRNSSLRLDVDAGRCKAVEEANGFLPLSDLWSWNIMVH